MIDELLDDYLWDRTGEADAEISELEHLLSRFRHDEPLRPIADAPDLPDESAT